MPKNKNNNAIMLATPSSVYPATIQQQPPNMLLPASHTAAASLKKTHSRSSSSKDVEGKVLNVKNVRDLSKAKKLYNSDEPMVILIYRDTCGFCEMMKPAWVAFSPKAVTKGVHVVNIDSSVLESVPYGGKSEFVETLKKSFGGFVPFVMKMQGPNDHAVYNGNRTPEDFAKFALQKNKKKKTVSIKKN